MSKAPAAAKMSRSASAKTTPAGKVGPPTPLARPNVPARAPRGPAANAVAARASTKAAAKDQPFDAASYFRHRPRMSAKKSDSDGMIENRREQIEAPSPRGIEYSTAARWGQSSLMELLKDDKGKQLFRSYLHQSLAEENLSFYDAVEEMKLTKSTDERKLQAQQILELFAPYLNVSGTIMQELSKAAESASPKLEPFLNAQKDVFRLLESDQFPRFKRSETYLKFLEALLPEAEAHRWAHSFESLLANQVGRWRFRHFLRSIHAEENLRFWEAVHEFRQLKNKSKAMVNLAEQIRKQYLAEGGTNEVFLPFNVRQGIEAVMADKQTDAALFDEAIRHVEQVLRNDPYVRFLQSAEYRQVLEHGAASRRSASVDAP